MRVMGRRVWIKKKEAIFLKIDVWSILEKWDVLECQTGIYNLLLPKLSQSNIPFSFPALNHPSSTNKLSPCPIHIYKTPASPVLITMLHPLEYILLAGNSYSVDPIPQAEGTYQVQGETDPNITAYLRVFPVPFGKQVSRQLTSFRLCTPPPWISQHDACQHA